MVLFQYRGKSSYPDLSNPITDPNLYERKRYFSLEKDE
jgi:hypothetical protein